MPQAHPSDAESQPPPDVPASPPAQAHRPELAQPPVPQEACSQSRAQAAVQQYLLPDAEAERSGAAQAAAIPSPAHPTNTATSPEPPRSAQPVAAPSAMRRSWPPRQRPEQRPKQTPEPEQRSAEPVAALPESPPPPACAQESPSTRPQASPPSTGRSSDGCPGADATQRGRLPSARSRRSSGSPEPAPPDPIRSSSSASFHSRRSLQARPESACSLLPVPVPDR